MGELSHKMTSFALRCRPYGPADLRLILLATEVLPLWGKSLQDNSSINKCLENYTKSKLTDYSSKSFWRIILFSRECLFHNHSISAVKNGNHLRIVIKFLFWKNILSRVV